MPSKSPVPPWAIHLFYWLLLAGVYFYFNSQKQEQLKAQRALGSCLQAACETVNRQNAKLLEDINRFTSAYRYAVADSFRHKATQTFRSVMRFQDELSAFDSANWDRLVSVKQNPAWQEMSKLQDSVWLSYRPVEEINVEIRRLLTGDNYQWPAVQLSAFLARADAVDRAQMLNSLKLRAALAANKALGYYLQNTMPDVDLISSALTPTLSPKKYCLKTGELFEADIFLSGYSPAQHYTEATVNGEPFPVRDGMLQYKRIFEKPGEHPLTVGLKYKNPLTGEVKSFLKTFYVYIRP